jgi:hypothetical protein
MVCIPPLWRWVQHLELLALLTMALMSLAAVVLFSISPPV